MKKLNKTATKLAIIRELQRRVKASQNGLKEFFAKAGVPLSDADKVTLTDMNNLQTSQPDIFIEAIRFLYPDAVKIEEQYSANADDAAETTAKKDSIFSGTNWANVIGSTLAGFGTGLANSTASDSESKLAIANAEYQAALAQQESESNKKLLNIILIIVGVVVVGFIVAMVIKKRK